MDFIAKHHIVTGLAPVADAFAGATVNSDAIDMKNYNHATFLVWKGVGTTGTSVVTVEACADAALTSPTQIPFTYRRKQDSDDIWGALTAVTVPATGFTTTAGSAEMYAIEVNAADLGAYGPFVRLDMAESANDPVLGGILVILSEPRYGAVAAIA